MIIINVRYNVYSAYGYFRFKFVEYFIAVSVTRVCFCFDVRCIIYTLRRLPKVAACYHSLGESLTSHVAA